MELKKLGKKVASPIAELGDAGRSRNMVAMYFLVSILMALGFMAATKLILPFVLGVSFTGGLAVLSTRLAATGGIIGGITGFGAERISNLSAYVITPLMNLNPFAIVGFIGWITLVSVLIVNAFTYKDVWR